MTASVLLSRPYFVATMVSYVVGLGLAFAANAVTHMGQPGETSHTECIAYYLRLIGQQP